MPVRTAAGVLLIAGLAAAGAAILTHAQSTAPPAATPGKQPDGTTLLANGWRLAPAGKAVTVGDMPLNVIQSPDSRYLIVSNNGLARPTLSVVDVNTWTVKNTTVIDNAWLGLAWHPDGKTLYVSGAGQNTVQEFTYADGVITRARTFALPASTSETMAAGIAVSRDGAILYVTRVFSQTVSAIDLVTGLAVKTAYLPSEPYTCVLSRDSRTLYVSLWGSAAVVVFEAPSLSPIGYLETGEHPNAMALSADDRRLFVTSASTSSIWVHDTWTFEPIEQISTSLYPQAPPTSTPNSLALSPDGQTLLAANADNNAVAVIDVSNSAASVVQGFIPTGWYPTGAIFSRDGKQIFFLSGKGLTTAPNPAGNGTDKRLFGALSAVPTPDRVTLNDYTRKVQSLTPYSDAIRLAPADAPISSPIPRVVGGSTPIKHVFYVIRENRTYDQILGDERAGNGDPTLVTFGKDVTPNAHLLAENFVLFDNFYVDADVSYNGHAFSTAAYATDFVEKMWQTNAGNRGAPYLTEGGGIFRNAFGNITAPALGYIWDYARRANVSVRSYGEFVRHLSTTPAGDVVADAAVPGLKGAVAPAFAGFTGDITDNKRVDNWLVEFNTYVANGNLPQLSIVRLGNDHTDGTRPGSRTPRAMVADNDLALGRVVEAISNSVYWKDSAVFVVEDDAQSGPDHVDSHRSVLLVASPFARRGVTDHTFYSTSSVLRTIELILGLPPMSEYDAAATPLYNAFQVTPALVLVPRVIPGVPLDEMNSPSSFGAAESMAMDFSDADRTPEGLLNEIIWRSVKGPRVPMPPPRRSLFAHRPGGASIDPDDK